MDYKDFDGIVVWLESVKSWRITQTFYICNEILGSYLATVLNALLIMIFSLKLCVLVGNICLCNGVLEFYEILLIDCSFIQKIEVSEGLFYVFCCRTSEGYSSSLLLPFLTLF